MPVPTPARPGSKGKGKKTPGPGGAERRRSVRRVLYCPVRSIVGLPCEVPAVGWVSVDGAFLFCLPGQHPPIGAPFQIGFALPHAPLLPVAVNGIVVREARDGVGCRFTDVPDWARSLLVQHVTHWSADEAVRRIQKDYAEVVPGKLAGVPITEGSMAQLEAAATSAAGARVFVPGGARYRMLIAALRPVDHGRLRVKLEQPERLEPYSPVYVAYRRGGVQYFFEAIVLEIQDRSVFVQLPDRVYTTALQTQKKVISAGSTRNAKLEILHPTLPGGRLMVPVIEFGVGAFTVSIPSAVRFPPGTVLPLCRLIQGGQAVTEAEAIVKTATPLETQETRIVLEFARDVGRDEDEADEDDTETGLGSKLRAAASAVGLGWLLGKKLPPGGPQDSGRKPVANDYSARIRKDGNDEASMRAQQPPPEQPPGRPPSP